MMKRLLIAAIMITLILFPSSCASKDPVELVAFSLYSNQFTNVYQSMMYIDYVNHTADKTIEQAELTVAGKFRMENESSETVFRLFDPEGVQNNEHNHEQEHKADIFAENETYTAYLSKVYFTDGSIWENTDQSGKITASVWGSNTKESSPIKLMEANFYRQYEGARDIEFNVDYINTSAELASKGLVFEVIPKNADGSVYKKSDGTDAAIYIPVMTETVMPGASNTEYHYTIPYRDTGDISSAAIFEIRIVRTLSDDGIICGPGDEEPLHCVMLGKKGYAFTEKANLKSLNKLIDSLNQQFKEYEMDEGEPLIYIRDHEYVILRYQHADIRTELDENNEIRKDAVSFSSYVPYDDYQQSETKESVVQTIENLYRCIFCTVLDEAPYEQILEAVNEFLENDSSFIELEDQSLYVTEDGGMVYDENGKLLINRIAGTGSGLTYNPAIQLTWAKNTIY